MGAVIHASIEPEPFGMVALEAMAQKKPVIATNAGGIAEIVKSGVTGYLYPQGDWHALASHIVSLLNHPEDGQAMGEAGYQRLIETFSLTQYLRQIHERYEAIVPTGSPPVAQLGRPSEQDEVSCA
jgi:glycosyltransferase involved in cell wall biosynthesis